MGHERTKYLLAAIALLASAVAPTALGVPTDELIACWPLLASGSIVLNGSFESPDYVATETDGYPYYLYVRTDILDHWTIDGSSLAVLDSRAPYWLAADGSQYLELESGLGRAIEQTLATTPGTTYTIRFAYAPNPFASGADDSLNVLWNGAILGSIDDVATSVNSLEWRYYDFTAMALNSTTVIRFEDGLSGTYYIGPHLDDVSMYAGPVPDPASLTLTTIGLAVLVLRRRMGQ